MRNVLILFLLVGCAAPRVTTTRTSGRTGEVFWVHESRDGVPDGLSRTYYPSGKVRSERYFLNAQFHGRFVGFYEDGTVALKAFYWHDVLVWKSRVASEEPPVDLLTALINLHDPEEIRRRYGNRVQSEDGTWYSDDRSPEPSFVLASPRMSQRPIAGLDLRFGGASATDTLALAQSIYGQVPWRRYAASLRLSQSQLRSETQTLSGRKLLELGGSRNWASPMGSFVLRGAVSFPVVRDDAAAGLTSGATVTQVPSMAATTVTSTSALRVGGSWLYRRSRFGVQLDLGADRLMGGVTPTFVHGALGIAVGIRSLYGLGEIASVRRLGEREDDRTSAGLGVAFRVQGVQVKAMLSSSTEFDVTSTLGVENEF